MRKVILTAILAAICMLTQPTLAQNNARWGITAGANINNIHFKQNNFIETSRGFGPQVGVSGEMNIAGVGFAVDGAILYSMRSGRINYGQHKVWSSSGLGNETCNMHYIDVPLHLKFKYHNLGGVENTIMPLIYAGPTFSFLAGKNLRQTNEYRPVSVLLQFGLGCELFKHLQVSAAFSFSVGETLRTRLLDENIAKNRCWSASVTYYFD